MSGNGGLTNGPPFPPQYRASGLLLHVTSLPSPYGIGDLGSSRSHGLISPRCRKVWQALPLGPLVRKPPYQSLSSFAGNALLISPVPSFGRL